MKWIELGVDDPQRMASNRQMVLCGDKTFGYPYGGKKRKRGRPRKERELWRPDKDGEIK